MSRPQVGVIGAGRVGSVLAARFLASGHDVAVTARSASSLLRVQTLLPGVPVVSIAEAVDRSDVLVIAVPDDELSGVVEALEPIVHEGQIVFHTSGAHGRAPLARLAARGARTMALHPAMTFTGTEIDLDRGCVFGATCAEGDAEIAETLIAELGGSVMWVAESDRPAYHAALAHGANHISTIVNQAMDQLRALGAADPAAVLRPLLTAALDNTLAYGDAALTGPVARGDVSTVRAHLAAIDDDSIRQTYRALALSTTDRAEASGRIDPITAEELRWTVELAAREAGR